MWQRLVVSPGQNLSSRSVRLLVSDRSIVEQRGGHDDAFSYHLLVTLVACERLVIPWLAPALPQPSVVAPKSLSALPFLLRLSAARQTSHLVLPALGAMHQL